MGSTITLSPISNKTIQSLLNTFTRRFTKALHSTSMSHILTFFLYFLLSLFRIVVHVQEDNGFVNTHVGATIRDEKAEKRNGVECL